MQRVTSLLYFFSAWIIKCYGCQPLGARWGNKTSHVLCPVRCTLREHLRGTVSEPGFEPGTCGLWSHHTSNVPLWCHMLLTYYLFLSSQNKKIAYINYLRIYGTISEWKFYSPLNCVFLFRTQHLSWFEETSANRNFDSIRSIYGEMYQSQVSSRDLWVMGPPRFRLATLMWYALSTLSLPSIQNLNCTYKIISRTIWNYFKMKFWFTFKLYFSFWKWIPNEIPWWLRYLNDFVILGA